MTNYLKKYWALCASLALGVAISLALPACEPPGKKVVPDRSSVEPGTKTVIPTFTWITLDRDEMQRVYQTRTGSDTYNVYGFVGYDPVTNEQIIVTEPPKFVDDEVACTLGHEVMHFAYGNYHK